MGIQNWEDPSAQFGATTPSYNANNIDFSMSQPNSLGNMPQWNTGGQAGGGQAQGFKFAGMDSLITGTNPTGAYTPTWSDKAFGYTNTDTGIKTEGYAGAALGAASGIAQSFLGWQQYQMAKKTFKENKNQFAFNANAQVDMTNLRMEERQNARRDANPNAWEDTAAYMDKNRIAQYVS